MTEPAINLYSDTQSRPTPAMRRAMAEAEVGDEQRGLDPTVTALAARVAVLLGKEAALFLPSGTLCNEIAILLHCRPGDEILCDRTSHLILAEGGGPAVFAGAMMNPIAGARGIFTAEQLAAAVRPKSRYVPASRLLSVEQTANFGGGTVWPLATLRALTATAAELGLARHMDGARLLNAVVASGVSAADFAEGFDTVWIDLSKGLGCPAGAVLAASAELIEAAWTWKQRMGGALRQAGILAAAGLHALDHHVERLAEDHANAKAFAEALTVTPGIEIDLDGVETNIVFFDLAEGAMEAASLVKRLRARGVDMSATGARQLRAVTHLDVTRDDVVAAAAIIGEEMIA